MFQQALLGHDRRGGGRFVMGHTHNFFDYLDAYQTRYLLDTRHWVRLDGAHLEVVGE